MVKRAKLAIKKVAERAKKDGGVGVPAGRGGPAPPPHQQRKLRRKVAFLEKVSASRPVPVKAAGVQKKKKRRPSVALSNLSSLADALKPGASKNRTAPSAAGTSVRTQKARANIERKESIRMEAVLQHPQFKANPIAAITSHLSATLPPPPPPPQADVDPKQLRREKKQRQKVRKAKDREDADMAG